MASASAATVSYVGSGTGKWSTAANWSNGLVPVVGDDVVIVNTATTPLQVSGNVAYGGSGLNSLLINGGFSEEVKVIFSKNLAVSGTTTIGTTNDTSVVQSGGRQSHEVMVLGADDSRGTVFIKKGSLTVGNLISGAAGNGNFDQSNSKVTVTNNLTIGVGFTSTSTYSLLDGRLSVSGTTFVGRDGHAIFAQTRGTSDLGVLIVGENSSGNGRVNLLGGTMRADSATIGQEGDGLFDHRDGTLAVKNDLSLGVSGTSGAPFVLYEMSGGALDVGGKILLGNGTSSGSMEQTGGKVTARNGVVVANGRYGLDNATLTTKGLSVAAGTIFQAFNNAVVRTTGDVHFDQTATVTTRGTSLIVGKGSNIKLSAVQADTGATASGLDGEQSWGSIKLERNVTLTLEGTAGVDAIYVNSLDIGSKNPFRVESIVTGNGVNMYYNADLKANKYLKGGTYDFANGGQLIPVHDVDTTTGGGLVLGGVGAVITTGTNHYGPGSEVLGGSLVLSAGSWAFELESAGNSDELLLFGDGDVLFLSESSFDLYDLSLFNDVFTTSGAYVLNGDAWEVLTWDVDTEASGTLAEREFSAPLSSAVPEPGSALLALFGAAALVAKRRRR